MPSTTYLVDVFAINTQGVDHHIGGGCFVADSASAAEACAASEFNAERWEASGHSIAFMTDIPERGVSPQSLEKCRRQYAERLITELDTTIPFND